MVDATLIAALGVAAAAGAVSGLAGFGFALVSVTPLLLLYDPPTVVLLTLVLTLVTNWVIVAGAVEHLQRRTVLGLFPAACPGLVIGAQLLRVMDADAIKLLAAAVVIAFTLVLMAGVGLPGSGSRWAVALSGMVSGVLGTSTGLSGPPVVMLFAARRFAPHPFRVSIAAYFMLIDSVGLAILVGQGTVRAAQFGTSAALLPAAAIGTVAGRRLVRYVSPEGFQRTVLVLLLVTGCVGAVTSLITLLS